MSGTFRGLVAPLEKTARWMIGRQLGQNDVDVTADRGQEIVEIVRDAAGQPSDGGHLLRLLRPAALRGVEHHAVPQGAAIRFAPRRRDDREPPKAPTRESGLKFYLPRGEALGGALEQAFNLNHVLGAQ